MRAKVDRRGFPDSLESLRAGDVAPATGPGAGPCASSRDAAVQEGQDRDAGAGGWLVSAGSAISSPEAASQVMARESGSGQDAGTAVP